MAYLSCECGSQEFVSWQKLKQTQAGGTVTEIGGYVCRGCNTLVDIGHLMRLLDRKRLELELRQKNEELENAKAAEAARYAAAKAKGKAAEEPELRNVPPRA